MASSLLSSRQQQSSAPRKRLGCETPRVFTPPLRALTEETTLGFSVIQFSTDVLGIELFPWQRWLLVHALELLPDGQLRFRTVVVLVARQNGKSTLSQVLALWFMFVLGCALVIGTAQDLDVAEEIWQGAVDIVEETPELNALKDRVVKVNGKKSLELTTGQRYKVKAANRRAGRGLSGDLILLDELREHQSWDSWSAITKTTMARAEAQVWALSNAGDVTSVVLRHLRKMAHAAVGDPDGLSAVEDAADVVPEEVEDQADEDTLGIFEWSASPGSDVWDRDEWAQANPSLGYSISERTVAAAAKTDPEWVFRTEVLCQWSDGVIEGPFPPGKWESCSSTTSRPAALQAVCVDVAWDRSRSHVALASVRSDGVVHVEIVASRAGTEWVPAWVKERREKYGWTVVAQATGAPVSSLIPDLGEVQKWAGAELGQAFGSLYDRVIAGTVAVLPHPDLDRAGVSAKVRDLGDGARVIDRKHSPGDASPLVAVSGAVFYAMQMKAPAVSAYESSRLMFV